MHVQYTVNCSTIVLIQILFNRIYRSTKSANYWLKAFLRDDILNLITNVHMYVSSWHDFT